MRSSKTSYTDRDFNEDLSTADHSVVAGSAGVVGTVMAQPIVFPSSCSLGRAKMANKGRVHLINGIWTAATTTGLLNGNGLSNKIFWQIRRRKVADASFAAFQRVGDTRGGIVAHEHIGCSQHQGGPGTPPALSLQQFYTYMVFPYPIVMVEPYFMYAGIQVAAITNDTITFELEMYIQYETMVIEGERYRRLLDAYTQMTVSPRGTSGS